MRSVILFGVPICSHRLQIDTVKNELTRLQSSFLRKIIRRYSSIVNDCSQVLAKQMPIDLEILGVTTIEYIKSKLMGKNTNVFIGINIKKYIPKGLVMTSSEEYINNRKDIRKIEMRVNGEMVLLNWRSINEKYMKI